jgi:hypothetical protein
MLELLLHSRDLLIKSLDFNFSRSDVSLELLDLVIENEFEFFKLLNLLF